MATIIVTIPENVGIGSLVTALVDRGDKVTIQALLSP